MKLLVALNESNGEDSSLSAHFGHCPFFGIYEDGSLKIVKNFLDHKDSSKTPVDQVCDYGVDLVFTKGIGKKAIELFSSKGVSVKTGKFNILREVIQNISELEEFSGGCEHNH